jgi:hypothetical protein
VIVSVGALEEATAIVIHIGIEPRGIVLDHAPSDVPFNECVVNVYIIELISVVTGRAIPRWYRNTTALLIPATPVAPVAPVWPATPTT